MISGRKKYRPDEHSTPDRRHADPSIETEFPKADRVGDDRAQGPDDKGKYEVACSQPASEPAHPDCLLHNVLENRDYCLNGCVRGHFGAIDSGKQLELLREIILPGHAFPIDHGANHCQGRMISRKSSSCFPESMAPKWPRTHPLRQ